MKLSIAPFLILLFIALKSISQETKKVVERTGDNFSKIEVKYYVLKDHRDIKHGPYEYFLGDRLLISGFYKAGKKDSVWQLYNSNGSVMTRKIFTENKRTGIWAFYDKDGATVWKHDFSNDSSVNKPQASTGYSYLSSNGEWVQGKADRDPVRLASTYGWQMFLSMNLRYPHEAIDKKQQGQGIVVVTIDENGDAIDYSIAPESSYPSLGEEALRIIKLFDPEYLPAEKDGKKVKIKVTIPITFRLRG